MKIITTTTLLALLVLSGCHNVPMWKYDMFKRPYGNKPYPAEYIQGWQDGCESGAEASATHFYRLKYEFRQDWSMLNNTLYVSGWESAYNHCRKYVLQHNLNKLGKRS
tara:strand:+ start:126 stop:449 length:324 start_codon:yes stop_codon:yes gene_type:complete